MLKQNEMRIPNAIVLLTTVFLFSLGHARAQTEFRNLNFEVREVKGNAIQWIPASDGRGAGYRIDNTTAHSGKGSYQVMVLDTVTKLIGVGASTLIRIPDLDTKRIISVTAFIKAQNLRDGGAAISIEQFDAQNRQIGFTNSAAQSKQGTVDWTMHSAELRLKPEAKSVKLNFGMQGKGMAWFDDFKISFDDVPVDPETMK